MSLPNAAVIDFFDNFVHDSRAWFKLIPGNPDSEEKAHSQLKGWVSRRQLGQANISSDNYDRVNINSGNIEVDQGLQRLIIVADKGHV